MSVFSAIRGIVGSIFMLGRSGPNIKDSSGVIELRNNADNAYVIARGADPVGNNDFVTKQYYTANPPTPGYGSGVVWYGDGSDGDVTISAGTTTLTRDMMYHNLTITGGQINTNGYRIYVSGTLDLSGATLASRIYCTAQNAGAYSGHQGGTGGKGTPRGKNGGNGASSGSSGSVSYGMNGSYGEPSSGWGGRGGNAANSTNALGGLGGTAPAYPYHQTAIAATTLDLAGGGGAGGGGNMLSSSVLRNGGGGGEGCPGIFIAAANLVRANTNAVGTIISTAGNGSDGETNCGAGCGGGGGAVVLIVGAISGTVATSLLRSVGGNNGASVGLAGEGGYGGTCVYILVGTSETTAGPTANSGTTGGTTSLTV